jgi:hypothetical protein
MFASVRLTWFVVVIFVQVEQSQTQWLTANQDLSYELEKALYQNKLLQTEVANLKAQLAGKNQQSSAGAAVNSNKDATSDGSSGGSNSGAGAVVSAATATTVETPAVTQESDTG